MSTSQTSQRVAVILNKPNDWDEWLEVIETKAVGGKRWEFVASLRSFIQETISRTFFPYTFNCDTPYDILVALRKCIAPTDKTRKLELTQ